MDESTSNTSNIDPDWRKVERDMTKVGLKDGLSAGRELNFQQSFDKGYEDGFHNGFNLGILKFQSEQKQKLETSKLLENARIGMCIVCTDEKGNENVDDIRKKQKRLVEFNIDKINTDLDISREST